MSIVHVTKQHPVPAAIACAALQFVLTTAILEAGMAFASPAAFGKVKLAAFASTILLPVLLAQVLGLWRQVGFGLEKIRLTPVFLVSMLLCAMFASTGFHVTANHPVLSEIPMQFFNAFGEELLFRGVIFAILVSQPRWQGIVLSGVLFGGMHLIHGFMDGNWPHALWWAAATSLSGMMFAAVRYATGSLWLTIVLHMLLNLSKIYSNIEVVAGADMLLAAERAAYAIELALTAWVLFGGRLANAKRQPATVGV